jgi:hypothetical protein
MSRVGPKSDGRKTPGISFYKITIKALLLGLFFYRFLNGYS